MSLTHMNATTKSYLTRILFEPKNVVESMDATSLVDVELVES